MEKIQDSSITTESRIGRSPKNRGGFTQNLQDFYSLKLTPEETIIKFIQHNKFLEVQEYLSHHHNINMNYETEDG